MGRKTAVVDPAIYGILGDPEVLGDLFDRGPWLSQWNVFPQLRSLRQYGMSKGILAGRIWQESDKIGYRLSSRVRAEHVGESATRPDCGFDIGGTTDAIPNAGRARPAAGLRRYYRGHALGEAVSPQP